MENRYKTEILNIISECKPNLFSKRLSQFNDIVQDLYSKTSFLNVFGNVSDLYRCIYYINDIFDFPFCKICHRKCDIKISTMYNMLYLIKNPDRIFYCSKHCYCIGNETVSKRKNTCFERYGVFTNLQSEECKYKIKETVMLKYGVTNPSQSDVVKEKKKQTTLQNYGVDNPFKSEIIKQKIKNTCLTKYNVEYNVQRQCVKDKTKKTNLEKYGVEHPSQNEEIRVKGIKTQLLKNYDFIYGINNSKSTVYILNSFEDFCNRVLNKNYVFTWKCKSCGKEFDYKLDPNMYPSYARCPECNPKLNGTSNMEKELVDFVCDIVGKENVIVDSFQVIPPKQIDIYIPKFNLAIEFDGLYWHSQQQIGDKNYHLNKTNECESKGIHLIHVFEDEWINKKDIVKSRIRGMLNSYDKKIYARKCEIGTVDAKTARLFLEQNHLQGAVGSKINLALYTDDEMVSLMTFGNFRKSMGRKSEENGYELLRFCSRLNYRVIGGAGKLFTRFIGQYKPSKIITYADRRWSMGGLYEKLGFTFVRKSEPNYWYVINNHREYRFKYRKQELPKLLEHFDPSKTEYDNMLDNGIDRVFDCGNYVFEMNF